MPSAEKPSEPTGKLHRAVRDAMLELGWIPPETEIEFTELEAQVHDDPGVPGELQAIKDPLDALRFTDDSAPAIIPFPRSDTQQNLARVARDGGAIPDDILVRMRRDRQRAEGNTDAG